MDSKVTISDRLLDLLVEEATCGLRSKTGEWPPDIPTALSAERATLMEAATFAQLGFLKLDEAAYREMPRHLRRRILAAADKYLDSK